MIYIIGLISIISIGYILINRKKIVDTNHNLETFENDTDDLEYKYDENLPQAINRKNSEVKKMKVTEGPFTEKLKNNFLIYIDFKKNIKRLLMPNEKLVFDTDFYRIDYNEQFDIFICVNNNGSKIYNALTKLAIDSEFNNITIDIYGNKINYFDYKTYGILDENYRLISTVKCNNLKGIQKDFYRGTLIPNHFIFDPKANVILQEMGISEYAIEEQILVQDSNKTYILFSLKNSTTKRLEYHEVFLSHYSNRKIPLNTANYYIAGLQVDIKYDNTNIYKTKYCLLDANGSELFKPIYDILRRYPFENKQYFLIGFGDEQLWDYYENEIEEFPDNLKWNMTYGVVDSKNNILVEPIYNKLRPIPDTELFFVNLGCDIYIKTECGEDSEWKSWTNVGGKNGVLNLKGEIIVPIEYEKIDYSLHGMDREIFFKAYREKENIPIYYNSYGELLN